MKTLLVLRHAKAAGSSPSGEDRDRPLTERGERDAKAMGKCLRKLDVIPDAVISSTATRARQTAEIVAEHCKFKGRIECRDDLYLPTTATLIAAIRGNTDADCLLVVGHNPGLEDLVNQLVAGSAGGVHLCTAALARIDFDGDDWSSVGETSGSLVWLLDPEVVDAL